MVIKAPFAAILVKHTAAHRKNAQPKLKKLSIRLKLIPLIPILQAKNSDIVINCKPSSCYKILEKYE